jgi:two-component sensor histidine kinase
MVNEVLSNAFKHGFLEGRSGTIRITLTDMGNGVRELVIADDGVGFPDGFDVARGQGLGMQIILNSAVDR